MRHGSYCCQTHHGLDSGIHISSQEEMVCVCVCVFTGGSKLNIFATTPGDNPIGITMSDYSA